MRFDLYRLLSSETVTFADSSSTALVSDWELVDTELSDNKGRYWFTDLEPGTYTVRENPDDLEAQNLIQTSDQAIGDPDDFDAVVGGQRKIGEDPSDPDTNVIVVRSRQEYVHENGTSLMPMDTNGNGLFDDDENQTAIDAVALKTEINVGDQLEYGNNFISGAVAGFKFEDLDGDGVYLPPDASGFGGEPALPGVVFQALNPDGSPAIGVNGLEVFTASGPDGSFTLMGLVPGDYRLVERLDLTDTNNDGISDDLQGMLPSTGLIDVTVTAAGLTDGVLVGNFVTGSIHGYKFLDLDADGVQDPGEGAFDFAAFEITDADGNPVTEDATGTPIGAGDGIVFTGSDGEFDFENLAPGTYTVTERLDLIDRNELNGGGLPDGNGVPDDQEGLRASTPLSFTVTILSRQEYVYADGAADLDTTQSADPSSLGVLPGTDISGAFPGVTLTEPVSGTPVVAGFDLSAGGFVFAHGGGSSFSNDFQSSTSSSPGSFLQAEFDLPVDRVSVDIIGNSVGDIGQLVAFDAAGNVLSSVQTGVLTPGQRATLTLEATSPRIASVQASGLGGFAPITVLVDNLQFAIDPLKTEINVGSDLTFGNYYSGGIQGRKTQVGSDQPAPGILLELLNMDGTPVTDGAGDPLTAVTDADGNFDFGDVPPGMYTVRESDDNGDAVIDYFDPVTVIVPHATVVTAAVGTATLYPGLQVEEVKGALNVENLIAGSIHGQRLDEAGNPVAGIVIELVGAAGVLETTTSGPDGQFHFENIDPRDSFGSGSFIVREVDSDAIADGDPTSIAVEVGSGEEHAAFAGQTDGRLRPGQIEIVTPGLTFVDDLLGGIAGLVFGDIGTPQSGLTVTLTDDDDDTPNLTTLTQSDGSFYFDDLPAGDYTVLVADQFADVTLDGGEEEVALSGQVPLDPGQTETQNPSLIFLLSGAAPKVMSVRAGSQFWTPAFKDAVDPSTTTPGTGAGHVIHTGPAASTFGTTSTTRQSTPLPWAMLNQLIIDFSEDVEGTGPGDALVPADFEVTGPDGPIPVINVNYDPSLFRATLTLSPITGVMTKGHYELIAKSANIRDDSGNTLDGFFVNDDSPLPSGDGTLDDDFAFEFAISPGNATGQFVHDASGVVDPSDVAIFGAAFGSGVDSPGYQPWADFSGNGFVGPEDVAVIAPAFGQPGLPPAASPVEPGSAPAEPVAMTAYASAVDSVFNDDEEDDPWSTDGPNLF